jgi:hypothetical protein
MKAESTAKNHQRPCGDRAINASEKAAAKRVPAIRRTPLFSD